MEQLRRLACQQAREHEIATGTGANRLLSRLDNNARALRAAHDILVTDDAAGQRMAPPDEWLLDNFYLIEQQIELTRIHLPRRYSRRLPRLIRGAHSGLPRVYGIAADLIAHLDGLLDIEAINAYVTAYQSVAALNLGELWAIPISLRLATIENLRRVAVLVAKRRQEHAKGIAWAERVLDTEEHNPKRMIHLLAEFADTQPKLSAPFLSELIGRLQGHGSAVAIFLNWIDQALAEEGTTVTQALQKDSHAQATEHLSIINSIGSLRFLGGVDWKKFVESHSRVEQLLRKDPAEAHALQDFATRDNYRHVVERLASRSGRDETEVARMALEQAVSSPARPGCNRSRHVGSYLIGGDRFAFRKLVGCPWSLRYAFGLLLRRYRLFFYLSGCLMLSLVVAAWPAWVCHMRPWSWHFLAIMAAAFIPATALAFPLINFIVTTLVAPHPLPRLDFSNGIPDAHRTMVVIPALLTSKESVAQLLRTLEIHYLGNRDKNLHFALLTDMRDAETQETPEDAELLQQVCSGIESLNQRYPRDATTTFHLYHRPRLFNPHERCWMSFERKRGKLVQFNALLRGEDNGEFTIKLGDSSILPTIRYVITLDSDTDLPRSAALSMVGAMAHPLNRPRFDPACGRVVEGYAILQPRVSTRLTSANRSFFSRLTSGEVGLDPYSREVSDVYQDLFSEGSFVGKGIYDVDAFRQALDNRFPENLILSHDLIESGYARSGLLGFVEVYEDAPSSYLDEINRQHRWMRGDWQILSWLGRKPPTGKDSQKKGEPVSRLTQWKILDNLRRCLVAPAMLVLLLLSWGTNLVPPLCWVVYILLVLGLTGVMRSVTLLVRKPRERRLRLHLHTWISALVRHVAQPLFDISVMPYEAWIALRAFACSALRMPFTRSGLLIWHLPEYRIRSSKKSLTGFYAEMWVTALAAVLCVSLAATMHPTAWLESIPLALLWLLAPLSAWIISQPLHKRTPKLLPEQLATLRRLTCTTWHYFDAFVTAEDNWLPPDNFQEVPTPIVASRTSPTNIGFWLTSCLAAWDFGYLTTETLLSHIEHTFDTMDKLELYRGHLFNWYNTQTLEPLPPRYVSTVDSGNLAASLVVLRMGLLELRGSSAVQPQMWQGMRDAFGAVKVAAKRNSTPDFIRLIDSAELLLAAPPSAKAAALETLQALVKYADDMAERATQENFADAPAWGTFICRICKNHLQAFTTLHGDAPTEITLKQLAQLDSPGSRNASRTAAALLKRLDVLIERCQHFQSAMDFRFLYSKQRELLSIGFDADARRLDPSCYDLLASEARITSLLLIADEQVPLEHWFALGRLLAGRGGAAALASWSGSMFEYLMPALFMTSYPGTLLDKTCHSVIQRQIRYGRQRNIPWGISESCYNATDANHVYQYRAFGVPGLGLKRGLSDDLVVAPYATLLALPFEPVAAYTNIQRLIKREGALGTYGLIEAIDYTPSRIPRGKQRAEVRAFMAHHQGMGVMALSHLLMDAPMVRRFMHEPSISASKVLLQERIPDASPAIFPHRREAASVGKSSAEDICDTMRNFSDPNLCVPEVHLLSNGRYHVMVNQAGGSSSHWKGLMLTRWREDITLNNWGTFLYLRDIESSNLWSNTYQPCRNSGKQYSATFTQGRAEYHRIDFEIDTKTEVCVSPEDDVEIRRITLTNLGRQQRHLQLVSYSEIVLAPRAADLAHRAFSNLFVRSEVLECGDTLLFTRRKREEHEPDVWFFHLLCVPGQRDRASCETDREKFLGRNRSAAKPLSLEAAVGTRVQLSNTAGAVLDPAAAVCHTVALDEEPLQALLVCGTAATRDEALALAEKYRDRHLAERAFDLSWSHSQIVMRLLNVSETEAQIYGRLASSLYYANPRNRAPWSVVASNRTGQQGLWRFGISGDLPIVLLRIADIRRLELVAEALLAHAYWRLKGLESDLIILNEDFSGYRATLNDSIIAAINASPNPELLDKPGGIFLRRIENLSEEDLILFQSVARVVLTGGAENLREQVERRYVPPRMPPLLKPQAEAPATPPLPLQKPQRTLITGPGGFSPDGREYIITLENNDTTPAPWSNVIAGKRLGMVVSESGGIYTWVDNAHEYRLTTWHNDPVSDPSGEAFYLRDEQTGEFCSLTPQPAPGRAGYICRHGFGYTVFEHHDFGIASELCLYAALDEPVRCAAIKLTNNSGNTRQLSLIAYHELVLGEWRHDNMMHIHTESDPQSGMLLAHNPYSRIFPQRIVFASCSEPDQALSGDRYEFVGGNGSLSEPDAMYRKTLSGRTGARYDPAAALQCFLTLAAGESREVVFTLGAADSVEDARSLRNRFGGPAGAHTALEEVRDYWHQVLGQVQVEIKDAPEVSPLLNGWLLYQTLACRIMGRSGYYQSGGAFGFRDQLQDAMALVHAAPDTLRSQILLAAERQFSEGDAQHWWHPPFGAGVRTRITDDRLWLPQAVARYIEATDDTTILDEAVSFLEARPLEHDEESRYDQHPHSGATASLYEHCVRAIKVSLQFGPRGLPLIGGGDWNDGMNHVGLKGKGESVWMAWFLGDTLSRFADIARLKGDTAFAGLCQQTHAALAVRANENAWDGAWYHRAYFDDGTPIGSSANEECTIDAISQSWAVLSKMGHAQYISRAMQSVLKHLVLEDAGIILLLAPPFEKAQPDPGYIRCYPRGIRENGGQYTHAAIWTTMAFAKLGDLDTAWRLFKMLNPINHTRSAEGLARYRVEPYVMAADIYGAEPHLGRGGWSWYTGAAGWMYRLALETFLGLKRQGNWLTLNPRLPQSSSGAFRIDYHFARQTYTINARRIAAGETPRIIMDGKHLEDNRIPLKKDGRDHTIELHYRASD